MDKHNNTSKPIKLKVLKGAPELLNRILCLTKKEDGLYYCTENQVQIIDAYGELTEINELSKKSIDGIFYDMHLFTDSYGNELKYIEEVEYLGKNY